MDDLIEALTIFKKYDPPAYFTHCEHDVLYVFVQKYVSAEDLVRLKELSFVPDEETGGFRSYRFGSC